MRYAEQTQITISEDQSNAPQNIRFEDAVNDVDLTSLAHLHDCSDSFPAGTATIGLGQIAMAKFLWIKPASTIQIILSGSATAITLQAGKASKLWAAFNSLSVVVPNTTQNSVTPVAVTIVVGG